MSFRIVGIGASAGGLESFSELIARLPASTGMAYIFVQHLDPRHSSNLVSILSKRATLPVEEVLEGMKVRPDHLYVIAPNTTLPTRAPATAVPDAQSQSLPCHRASRSGPARR